MQTCVVADIHLYMYACVGMSIVCTCVLGTSMCIYTGYTMLIHTTHLYTISVARLHVTKIHEELYACVFLTMCTNS